MNFSVYSLLYLFIGLGLGLFYFGGLWLTIKNMNNARSPIVLTLGSFILRTGNRCRFFGINLCCSSGRLGKYFNPAGRFYC